MLKKIITLNFLLFSTFIFSQNSADRIDVLYKDIAISHNNKLNTDSTVNELKALLALSSLTPERRLKSLFTLATLYQLKGNHSLSLKTIEQAQIFASEKKLYLWEARTLGFMSSIYRTSGMTTLSEKKLRQALMTAKKSSESQDLYHFYSSAYHEMAYYAINSNDLQKAISYIQQSNLWTKKVKSPKTFFLLASNYQYTGTLFNRLGIADSAIFYFKASLLLTGDYTDLNTKTLKNYVFVNQAYSFMLKNDYKAAKKLLTKVSNDSAQFKTTGIAETLYENWIIYCEKTGNTDSLRLFRNKLDSLDQVMEKSNYDAINTVTEQLNTENESLKRSGNAANWWYISGGIIVLAGAGLFLFFKRKFKKNEIVVTEDDNRQDDLNIAKETEQRLIEHIKDFEHNKQFLDTDISATLLANQLRTNTKYITYILRKLYNQDFNNYINTLRVNYIVDLLKNEPKYRQYKISYLAKICGYSSHSNFTAIFKKVKGYSPSEYILTLKEDETL